MAQKKIRKHFLNVNVIYVLAAVFSIAFLVGGIVFFNHTETEARGQYNAYMMESTQQSREIVGAYVEADFNTLSSFGRLYGEIGPADTSDMLYTLQQSAKYSQFARVGLADNQGAASYMDGDGIVHSEDISESKLYQQALGGEQVLSAPIMLEGKDEQYYFYFAPVQDANQVTGVVFAASPLSKMREIINHSAFGGRGHVDIIARDGTLLVCSLDSSSARTDRNFFDVRENELSEDQEDKLKDDLLENKESCMFWADNAHTQWMSYCPLGINDWFIIYTMPHDQMVFDYQLMSRGMIAILILAAAIFIFFLLFIRWLNRKNMRQLEEHAYIDPLTGYRSYQKFLMDAERILTNSPDQKYSVWYCDIKNFKYVNDLFGYEVGDHVLKYWGMVLEQDTQEGEVFGRVDADNYVCLRKYDNEKELKMRFDLYATMLQNFNETAEQGYAIEMSAGIYLIDAAAEDEKLTINDMLDRANVAQKSIKNLSGSRVSIYSKVMREKIVRETEMEARMESALLDGEFEVYLQPKIAIQEQDRVMGAEALVRWNWPGRGLVPPVEFIPQFEKNGFIVRLDEFVLEQACQILQQRRISNPDDRFTISVNVSRIGILQPTFIERYVYIKDKYQVPDGCLELEFTESIAFENHLLFRNIVRQLQARGFGCSLDDFGSGHSSLNLLKDLPVDVLKIDRLFFIESEDGSRDNELIKAVVNMARALNMQAVAEGVEHKEQVEMLRRIGCDIIQGYVYSPPLPLSAFNRFESEMKQKQDKKSLSQDG